MVAETDERTDERAHVDITAALEQLTTVDRSMLVAWQGRVEIKVNIQDARAAQLLLDLMDKYEPITYGEAEDIILAALWWLHFYNASVIVEKTPPTPPTDTG